MNQDPHIVTPTSETAPDAGQSKCPFHHAGKTGTSNQSKDTWFSGYSTEIAATVWVGYDDGKPLGGTETGGTTALPAWVEFMKVAHEHKPPSEFPRPAGVVAVISSAEVVAVVESTGLVAPPVLP